MRDRIVVAVKDTSLRGSLVDLEDLDLQKCISKAEQFISHHEQSEKLVGVGASTEENLDEVISRFQNGRTMPSSRSSASNKPSNGKILWKNCLYCRYGPHSRDNCPARNSLCNTCKMRGNWARSKICNRKKVESTNELAEELFLGSESE